MTRMLALMKVYFSLLYFEWRKWMPKNVIECWLKCKNRYWIWFTRECSLFRANECIFALLVAFECIFSSNEQQKMYNKLSMQEWKNFRYSLKRTSILQSCKKGFTINLGGLSCVSLWFALAMCLCSLNQALSFGKTKIEKKSIPCV